MQAIILGNGKGSRKLEIKIDYVVNNVLLMVPTLFLSVDLKFGKIFIKTLKIKSNLIKKDKKPELAAVRYVKVLFLA